MPVLSPPSEETTGSRAPSPARPIPTATELLLALVLTAATTAALIWVQRLLAGREVGLYIRPYGIAYIIPTALLTAVCGWRCGAATLLLSVAFTAYFLMEPYESFRVAHPRDIAELCFMAVVGGIVIAAVSALRHNAELQREARRTALQQRNFLRDVLDTVSDSRLLLCDTEEDLPPPSETFGERVPLSTGSIRPLRTLAQEAAESLGLSEERVHELMTAVSEAAMNAAAMNAAVHAGGGEGRVSVDRAGKTVRVWVSDRGRGIAEENLHRATLKRGYTTAGTLGHGFWLMLHTVDRLWLLTGPAGTTVVLEQGHARREHAWHGMDRAD